MLWDFAFGLPMEALQITIVYAVFDGTQTRSPVRRTSMTDVVTGANRSIIAQQRLFTNVCVVLCICVTLFIDGCRYRLYQS